MELTTPIAIFWDLPAGTGDTSLLLRICTDIVACRPLILHLHVTGPEIGEGVYLVLKQFTGMPTAVSLTLPAASLDGPARALLHAPGRKEILLAVDRIADLGEEMAIRQLFSDHGSGRVADEVQSGASRPVLGISFPVTRENWRELPELVTFCREWGIPRLVLPMQRLYQGESPFLLDREEQRVLAESLAAAGGVAGMDLTVHDPFLWRAFNPGVPFPQGGCQAANTMLAIAPNGDVYPCPTLPVRLGAIGEATLKEIAVSAEKKAFRRGLLEYPAGCRGCPELAGCRGGCRGRSYAIHGSLAGADPSCG